MKRLAVLLFLVALCGCSGKSNPTGFDQSRTKYAKATGRAVLTNYRSGYLMIVKWPEGVQEEEVCADMDRWAVAIEKYGKSAAEDVPNAHIR